MAVEVLDFRRPAEAGAPPVTSAGIPLLPENPPRFGPVTRRLMLRSALILAALFVAGTALVVLGGRAATAVGLSLLIPGGGFLYTAWPLLFVVTLLLFWVALILWWGASAWTFPWTVVAAAATGAGALADGPRLLADHGTTWAWAIPGVYMLYAAVLGSAIYRTERMYRRKVASIPELNAYLKTATPPPRPTAAVEPGDLDGELLAWLLEMSLQPLDEFDGFDYGEQLHGGTCLRYELNVLGAALAAANVNLLPNYPGLLRRAQENLVAKNTDIRVWRFWRVENILGNFDWNPDPIVRDNIMFSGFLSNQIAEMEAATGSTRFDEPGSLEFAWKDGRVFSYDHHSLNECLAKNYLSSELGLFPCEPGWVFSACNTLGAEGLRGYDVLHGTDVFERVEPSWRAGLFGEMMTPDGAIRHVRSTQFGFTYRDGDNIGEYFTTGFHGFVDTAPDMARRGQVLQLRGVAEKLEALKGLIKDGVLEMELPVKPERGTRYVTSLGEWFRIYAGARMVGNEEVAEAASRSILRECGTGAQFPDRPLNGGVMTLAMIGSTRWGAPLSTGEIVQRGYQPPVGPILERAPWPEVLVTKARSDDGMSLDLVVEPYRAPAGEEHELTFAVDETGPRHRLIGDGIDIVAEPDTSGHLTVAVPIAGRTSLNLRPI
jgi:hypothetical protein